MRLSEDEFLSHCISRKIGLCLPSPEPRAGREGYTLRRRTARRERFLSQEENKGNQKEIFADA